MRKPLSAECDKKTDEVVGAGGGGVVVCPCLWFHYVTSWAWGLVFNGM